MNFTNVREFIGAVAFSADKEFVSSQITFGNFFTSDEQNIDGNLNESLTDIFRGTLPTMLNDNIKASITLPKSLLDGIQYGKKLTNHITLFYLQHVLKCYVDVHVLCKQLMYRFWFSYIGVNNKAYRSSTIQM